MPLYEYEVIDESGNPVERFEVFQRMDDPALTVHPETGKPVRKVVARPNLAGEHYEKPAGKQLSDKNLERLGFTKYVKSDKGGYDRAAGSGGPEKIGGPG